MTGCASFGVKQLPPVYPELPSDLRICFDKIVPAPAQGSLSKKDIIDLIAKLKVSETTKTDCGKRLIQFYDNLGKRHV